jgi:hypothetical protein
MSSIDKLLTTQGMATPATKNVAIGLEYAGTEAIAQLAKSGIKHTLDLTTLKELKQGGINHKLDKNTLKELKEGGVNLKLDENTLQVIKDFKLMRVGASCYFFAAFVLFLCWIYPYGPSIMRFLVGNAK